MVASPSLLPSPHLAELHAQFRNLPILAYGSYRADDGALLLEQRASGVIDVAVEGVDDAVIGELVLRNTLTAARTRDLADAPRTLRLDDPFQRRVWQVIVTDVESPLRTADLAHRLKVSREHLSRQFGAGGAPHLKRVIDLTRIATAAQLAANLAYSLADVARLLGFTSASHLAATARRVAGVPASELASLGPRGVLVAFVGML